MNGHHSFILGTISWLFLIRRYIGLHAQGLGLPISELDLVLVWVEAKHFLGSIPEEERDFDRAKATFIRNN